MGVGVAGAEVAEVVEVVGETQNKRTKPLTKRPLGTSRPVGRGNVTSNLMVVHMSE